MDKKARIATYLGVALISMAALANEIILTRIFSVTLWYHFAFSVISLALLGSGAAGVWLHLSSKRVENLNTSRVLIGLAAGFAAALFVAFWLYLQIPLTMGSLRGSLGSSQIAYLALAYLVLTTPYLFVGAALALALRAYPADTGRLYFADLAGAGLGCVLSVAALEQLGGVSAILLLSLVAAFGALFFALGNKPSRLVNLAVPVIVLVGFSAGLGYQIQQPWLELPRRETYQSKEPLFEGWNSFSRITVYEDTQDQPFGWGLSPVYLDRYEQGQVLGDPSRLLVLIDEKAGTPIMRYRGVTGEPWFEYLKWDLTALPYYLINEPQVFIIGPGGGRDVVTAYEFEASRITGAELNPLIVNLVKETYADYSGNIYNLPNVQIVRDDARTYLAYTDAQYDIIQASLIDTLAASSAGAFALSENGIYTREAFLNYYDHLTDRGMVNFSRWYYPQGPAETLRLVALGLDTWARAGVENPAQHIIVVANLDSRMVPNEGLAGMLLKKTPFTDAEIARVFAVADEMGFEVLYAPGQPADNPVSDLIIAPEREAFIRGFPLDISPPTDNRPFFFNVVRFTDLNEQGFSGSTLYSFGVEADTLLIVTLGIVVVLASTMIILPLAVAQRRSVPRGSPGYILYFAALGLAFILVEIPMLQRLNIYLGSPTYALVVVLFALLVFSGIGSFTTQRVPVERIRPNIRTSLVILLALMVIMMLLLPAVLKVTQGWPLPARIAMTVALLAPLGLMMGRPFPLALRHVGAQDRSELVPWLWAINSALSVVASVLSVIVSIHFGFTAVFVLGLAAYAGALLALSRFE